MGIHEDMIRGALADHDAKKMNVAEMGKTGKSPSVQEALGNAIVMQSHRNASKSGSYEVKRTERGTLSINDDIIGAASDLVSARREKTHTSNRKRSEPDDSGTPSYNRTTGT